MIRRYKQWKRHMEKDVGIDIDYVFAGFVITLVILFLIAENAAIYTSTEAAEMETLQMPVYYSHVIATPKPTPTLTPAPTPTPEPTPEPTPTGRFNDDQLLLFAKVIHLEAGNQSMECMKAVGSVILNRMDVYGMTLEQVIYADNQFTVVDDIPYCVPCPEAMQAASDLNVSGSLWPKNMLFFRASYYHDWGVNWLQDYMYIDNTYFSLNLKIEA